VTNSNGTDRQTDTQCVCGLLAGGPRTGNKYRSSALRRYNTIYWVWCCYISIVYRQLECDIIPWYCFAGRWKSQM